MAAITPPNFAAVRRGDNHATEGAIKQLYLGQLADSRSLRVLGLRGLNQITAKVLSLAPTVDLDNQQWAGFGVVAFTGTTAVNVSGFQAPETDETAALVLYVVGSGTITLEHEASSEALNRITTSTGANKARTTGTATILVYIAGRWRELSL